MMRLKLGYVIIYFTASDCKCRYYYYYYYYLLKYYYILFWE